MKKHQKNHGKCAFTLAEVLVTLAIIGVVAALTIPTVVRNYTEKQTVVQLKKVYSQLNSAFQMTTVENGNPTTWNWGPVEADADTSLRIFNTFFVPYLKITKNCGHEKGCWFEGDIYNLSGYKIYDGSATTTQARARLADGTSISLHTYGGSCTASHSKTGRKPANRMCGEFNVDINGNKGPNIEGRDIFKFVVSKTGIYPTGIPDSIKGNMQGYCNKKYVSSISSWGCAVWVIQHKNLDYLRKDFTCTGGTAGVPYNCTLN